MLDVLKWTSRFALTASCALGLITASGALAQQWQVSQTDPSQPAVAIIPGSGEIVGMGLLCDGAQPFLLMNLRQAPGRDPVAVALTINGARYSIPLTRFGQPTSLAGRIEDAALIDALAVGQSVQVNVAGREVGRLPLAGSGSAFSTALASCWRTADAQTPAATEAPPPQVPAAEQSAIMRAAGFTRRGSSWTTCGGEETGTIEQMRDLNGDGRPEALVIGQGQACHGFVGSGFVLLTQGSSGWRIVLQQSGIPALYTRPGIAWPDLEIGGPGSDCFPFLRWDGQAYVDGGTSLAGEICTLRPRFAASAAAQRGSPAAANEGILSQIPVRLGYYVPDGQRCERPTYLYKFESRRHLEIANSGGRVEVLVYDYSRVAGPQDGTYRVQLANPGPEDPEDILIAPVMAGRLDLTIQDTVPLVHCQLEQVPVRLRR